MLSTPSNLYKATFKANYPVAAGVIIFTLPAHMEEEPRWDTVIAEATRLAKDKGFAYPMPLSVEYLGKCALTEGTDPVLHAENGEY